MFLVDGQVFDFKWHGSKEVANRVDRAGYNNTVDVMLGARIKHVERTCRVDLEYLRVGSPTRRQNRCQVENGIHVLDVWA